MEMKTVTLATVKEVVPLFNAYREFYNQPSDLEQAEQFLKERLQKEESIIFLAYLDAQPVGFVQLFPIFSSVAMKKAFLLNDLFVAEHARKQGVAMRLIEECYAYCKNEDARYITLETATDNKQAQKLYEKLGMKIDHEVFHYIKYW
ncbi:GNAT family N-acetyltransferase [Lysinibacillus pakistanensis]|uniref:GNAT family N-acetyltransferase n=1 Tax=Lysinibacillus pakistanensis TaxID=759811 RepID=A0AAX3X3S3_9BACI|nr:GNAT family N-acetyltransferase [Lysinibacillus pakistanensis]MDM5233196.1 GNAT family N-acetyltransferase [Lysinibacillus pakistanensis]QGG51305.1 GNAT family N-acetyltransferase [Lysinibacillus pakistanensis]WHY48675.1 GNAT family N-acetyltransferase [Lysinibacillus pakistanensis]WHY53688.1 GNAT family N-acetyltransferase [Lysinibacillus pakistanensis]